MAIPKLKANQRVEILWHDAHDCDEEGRAWVDRSVTTDPIHYSCLSMGYYLKTEDGFMYIAGDLLSGFASRVFAIPEGCVREIKKL